MEQQHSYVRAGYARSRGRNTADNNGLSLKATTKDKLLHQRLVNVRWGVRGSAGQNASCLFNMPSKGFHNFRKASLAGYLSFRLPKQERNTIFQ